MRQVDEAELVWRMKLSLRRMPKSWFRDGASRETRVYRAATQVMAELLAKELHLYDVLSSARPDDGNDLFTGAAYERQGALQMGDPSSN